MPFERFLHFLVVTSFLLLVITGMPLKFYYTDWAKTMFRISAGRKPRGRSITSARSSPSSTSPCTSAALVGKAGKGRKSLRDPETGQLPIQAALRPSSAPIR